MAYTEKYCVKCRGTLSRKDQLTEATAFITACRSTEGNTVRATELIIEEDGVCFVCVEREIR